MTSGTISPARTRRKISSGSPARLGNIGAGEARPARGDKARGDRRGAGGERRLGAGGAAAKTQQRLAVKPFLGQHGAERPHARAGVSRIAIGGVGQKRMRVCRAAGDQLGLAALQQGARVGEPDSARGTRHAGEPAGAAAAQQAEKDGLGLIVGVMGGGDDIRADAGGMREQEFIARLPGASS